MKTHLKRNKTRHRGREYERGGKPIKSGILSDLPGRLVRGRVISIYRPRNSLLFW